VVVSLLPFLLELSSMLERVVSNDETTTGP
jgi:hypothetical protein